MNKIEKVLIYVIGMLVWSAIMVGLASMSEPQSSWLVCDIMGLESVCQ